MTSIMTISAIAVIICAIATVYVYGAFAIALWQQWRFDHKVRNLSRSQLRERARRTIYR